MLNAVFCVLLTCGKEKPQVSTPAKTAERAQIIRAYFNTPLKTKAKVDGFWSVDTKEFAAFLEKTQKVTLPTVPDSTRYFLRIEGSYCDELFFVNGGDFTISAGSFKQLEKTKDRTAFSVVFDRQLPGGIKLNQGAILSVYRPENRLMLAFPDHTLTFFRAAETPGKLAELYGNVN